MPARALLSVLVALLALASPAQALDLPDDFDAGLLAMDLDVPTGAVIAPNGRVFVIEKAGRLKAAEPGDPRARLVLDLTDRVNNYSDRGLLGIALDSDFAANRRLYLLYVYDPPGGGYDGPEPTTSRLTYVEVADDGSVGPERLVLGGIPAEEYWHTIGTVRSAPDGTLFVGTGDATVSPDPRALEALEPDSLRGKILRVDRQGNGLPGNPFCPDTTDLSQACAKVFAGGFRNPYRFQLRESGGLVVGDVGSAGDEELSLVEAGELHGWPCFEAEAEHRVAPYFDSPTCQAWRDPLTQPAGARFPDYAYPRDGGAAIVAGPEYTGEEFPDDYAGSVFFGDYVKGFIRLRRPDGSIHGFAEGWLGVALDPAPDGEGLISVELGDGSFGPGLVRLITHSPGARTPVARVSASPRSGPDPLEVSLSASQSSDADGDPLTFEWDFGDGSSSAFGAEVTHTYSVAGSYIARLTVTDTTGRRSWATVRIVAGNPPTLTLSGDTTFRPSEPVRLTATAHDVDDGPLTGERITWRVILVHDSHLHPHTTGTGSDITFLPDPVHGADGRYRVVATATDSDGLATSVTNEIAFAGAEPAGGAETREAADPATELPQVTPDRTRPQLTFKQRGRVLKGRVSDASRPVRVSVKIKNRRTAPAGARRWYRWNEAKVGAKRWRLRLRGLPRGRYRIRIRATDAAGNRRAFARTVIIRRK